MATRMAIVDAKRARFLDLWHQSLRFFSLPLSLTSLMHLVEIEESCRLSELEACFSSEPWNTTS
jgi:hypothetical protein